MEYRAAPRGSEQPVRCGCESRRCRPGHAESRPALRCPRRSGAEALRGKRKTVWRRADALARAPHHSRRGRFPVERPPALARSEEHTSELQSPDHLVCRLLLEKKKDKMIDKVSELSYGTQC